MVAMNFRFGDWTVNASTNTLSRGDVRRQLEPRAINVLLHLCRQAGVVVSSEELLRACWGSVEFGDNPVHKAIAQLRRALDDSSATPRYIETIRKRGYRTVAETVQGDEAASNSWLHDSPFRGLEAFEEKHAAIFFGRKHLVQQLEHIVLAQADQACAMVLVLGPSGSGKTSLIRAGLVPQLLRAGGAVSVACHVGVDCADFGSARLFQALGSVLLDCDAAHGMLFENESGDSLGRRLEQDIDGVIAQMQRHLPHQRLLLVVDRLEAIFHLALVDDQERSRFIDVLEQLARSGSALVVLACRNDFYPQLAAFAPLMALKQRGGHFDVPAPSQADVAQIIRQPARVAGLHFGRDEAGGATLDELLCEAANTRADMLPLLQYCLQELYLQRSATGELEFAVFKRIGGIEGAIGARAEQAVASLSGPQIAALPQLLSHLIAVSETDMAVTARHVPWSALHQPDERALVEAMVAARLFVSDLSGGQPCFGIAHEALLRRWPRVSAWIDVHRLALQSRTRIGTQTARWLADGRPRDLLLPAGSQVRQASELLAANHIAFSAQQREFVAASQQRARRAEWLRLSVLGVVVGLALLACGLGLLAYGAQQKAELQRTKAEGLMGTMLGDFAGKVRPLGRLDLLDSISASSLDYLSDTEDMGADAVSLNQRAKALQLIAEVAVARADPGAARKALRAAHAILQRQLAAAPSNKELLKNAGGNAFWQGQIALDQNDWGLAADHFRAYLGYSDQLAASVPDDADGWVEQSYAHSSLGSVLLKQGKLADAAGHFQRSVDLKSQALARAPQHQSLAMDLANSVSWLASANAKLGLLVSAAAQYRRERDILTRLHEAVPGNALWTNRLSLAWSHQAELETALGRSGNASLDQARQLLVQATRQDPSNRNWQLDLISVELKLPDELAGPGGPAQAWARQGRLEAQLAALIRLEPKKLSLQRLAAVAKQRAARLALRLAQADAARSLLQQAEASLHSLHARAPDDQAIAVSLADNFLYQSAVLARLGNQDGSRSACRGAQAALQARIPGSRDFHLLVPWVLAHACTGDLGLVSEQQEMLAAMQYRDPAYLQSLPTMHLIRIRHDHARTAPSPPP